MVLPSPAAAGQRERIIAAGYALAPVLAQAWRSFGRPEADIRHVATSLDVPTWIAWAKRDRVIPLSRCLPCIRSMRHAVVTTFDAGHAAFLEAPEQFVKGFRTFVAALPVPSSPPPAPPPGR